jgi:hypothetical protein
MHTAFSSSDDLVRPIDDGVATCAMFEHFGGDEAAVGAFAGLLRLFSHLTAATEAHLQALGADRIEDVCVDLEIGVQPFGEG